MKFRRSVVVIGRSLSVVALLGVLVVASLAMTPAGGALPKAVGEWSTIDVAGATVLPLRTSTTTTTSSTTSTTASTTTTTTPPPPPPTVAVTAPPPPPPPPVAPASAPVVPAAPAAPVVTPATGLVGEILALHNQARAAHGLAPFTLSPCISSVAQAWSNGMALSGSLSHNSLSPVLACGGSAAAENIGTHGSVRAIHDLWMVSPGHLANILDPAFTTVGIGITRDAAGGYWATVDFSS